MSTLAVLLWTSVVPGRCVVPRFLLAILAPTSALSGGCRKPEDTGVPSSARSAPTAPPAAGPSKSATVAESVSSAAVLTIPGAEPLMRRPSDDGWSTEAWTELADEQLHRLADLIETHDSITASDVASLVTESFKCSELVPSATHVVFQDDVVRVERALNDKTGVQREASATIHKHTDLVQAVNELIRPLQQATERHCKFKVFRVEATDTATQAVILLQLSGVTGDRRIQQSASWETHWSTSRLNETPRLTQISSRDYERSDSQQSSAPLFADCTEAILGAESSFRAQLVPGLDHWLRRLEVGPSIVATSYHGIAVGDANGDGLDDVYVCQPGGTLGGLPNRLYAQQADGTARDISAEAGVDWLVETASALFADLDNDGDQDLAAATMVGVVIALNDGRGHFRIEAMKTLPECRR